MIKLYTDTKYAPKDLKWVFRNDATFDSNIVAKKLDKKDLQLMFDLEGLTLIDKQNNLFKSSTGVITIDRISTGLKTLLNIRMLKKQHETHYGVDITECGSNILDFVFEEVLDGNIPVLLRHWDILSLKDRYMKVNGTQELRTMKKLYSLL